MFHLPSRIAEGALVGYFELAKSLLKIGSDYLSLDAFFAHRPSPTDSKSFFVALS